MKALNKALAGLALGLGVSTAWIVGNGLVKDVQFARAEQKVDATREQISNIQDMASVYKAVNKAVEPSVVKIDVRKTVQAVGAQRFDDDMLRRFFGRDRDGDGQPDAPDGGFQFDQPNAPEQYQQEGTGSGVIMESQGDTAYIVTNNHVAGGASEMTVTLSDGRQFHDAKLVGADPKSDLAVIKIEANHVIPAKWGDSDVLEKGDIIMAFGSPFGFVGSMTHGIVSALNRTNVMDSQDSFRYENFIQVDAPINPGNSGGPLVNLHGEVIGINTAIATRSGGFQGIGFAIPSNQAKSVFQEIKSKGRVVRGWLGIGIADVAQVPDEATAAGFKGTTGVLVKQVYNETPASGKLQSGDVITSLNDKPIETMTTLRSQIAATEPGKEVTLGVFRDGKQIDVKVKLDEQPDDYTTASIRNEQHGNSSQDAQNAVETAGLRLSEPTDELTQRYGLDSSAKGAIVTGVRTGSAADQAGLRPGDVITRVGATAITSPNDVADTLAKQDLNKGVSIHWTNRNSSRFGLLKTPQK